MGEIETEIAEGGNMKKFIIFLIFFIGIGLAQNAYLRAKDLEIKGGWLISSNPPFMMKLPSEFRFIHSFSHENPKESSRTRVFFYIKERGKKLEEMFILQIADKTNPQASPITTPPLKPYTEKRRYSQGKVKKGDLEVEYLIQLMAWNPEASSLRPIIERGISIPHQWALQGQFQFIYLGEHAVLTRYSKEIQTFGLKVSTEGKDWERERLSGNEKRIYELFNKSFMDMIMSIEVK